MLKSPEKRPPYLIGNFQDDFIKMHLSVLINLSTKMLTLVLAFFVKLT